TSLDLLFGSRLTVAVDGGGQSFAVGAEYDFFVGRADDVIGAVPGAITFVPTDFAHGANPGDFALTRSADLHSLILTFIPTPVPEPGTLALLGFAAAAGWQLRRRFGTPGSGSAYGPP